MTSGGITKRTALIYTSAAFFIAALLFALWGHGVWQKMALLWMAFGFISGAGSWFAGVAEVEDPDAEEWAKSIK
jgi:predicted MFS family arabinose efflux permease